MESAEELQLLVYKLSKYSMLKIGGLLKDCQITFSGERVDRLYRKLSQPAYVANCLSAEALAMSCGYWKSCLVLCPIIVTIEGHMALMNLAQQRSFIQLIGYVSLWL